MCLVPTQVEALRGSMSNRFHNKWHRHNHHTYQNINEADSSFDPIASPTDPFKGDFALHGSLSAYAPLSAYAGIFQSNNIAICAIGGTIGIYASGVSHDSGNVMLSTWQDDVIFPDVSKPAIYVDGSLVVTNAVSANSLWVTQLYAVSSIVRVTDTYITELSGFNVLGSDFSQTIPDSVNISTQQGLFLSGVGLSGSSWAAYGGDIQTHNNLRVDNNAYVSANEFVGNNLYVSGAGFVEDALTITNGNLYVSGNGFLRDNLYVTGSVSALGGNSNKWNSVYSTVTSASANWNSVYSTVTSTSAVWNGSFCNNTVYLNQVSACSGNISLSGNITFTSTTSAVTFTNRVSTTLTNPVSTGWLIVNVAGIDRAILLYNFK